MLAASLRTGMTTITGGAGPSPGAGGTWAAPCARNWRSIRASRKATSTAQAMPPASAVTQACPQSRGRRQQLRRATSKPAEILFGMGFRAPAHRDREHPRGPRVRWREPHVSETGIVPPTMWMTAPNSGHLLDQVAGPAASFTGGSEKSGIRKRKRKSVLQRHRSPIATGVVMGECPMGISFRIVIGSMRAFRPDSGIYRHCPMI